ncbi:O-antigen ligase family protein [Pseudoalteromonas ostreae]|uniref:O-antigen ligase family protein n=1 Tax=Pseudoalteromonas ostreae TaxID=2774154 RepID=UPI001B383F72|nr:O-antigen ligase family protein [Pseudoalteromonas ostreae]
MRDENKLLSVNRFITGLFVSSFIFSIYNRTFSLFGDVRYIVIIFLLFNIFTIIIDREKKGSWKVSGSFIFLAFLFFSLFLLDQISWLVSDLPKNKAVYTDVVILYAYHFLAALVFIINRHNMNKSFVINSILFSSVFLSFSCFYQALIGDLPFVSENSSPEVFKDNLSILGVRPGGYSHDPNYTSLLMVFSLYVLSKKDNGVFGFILTFVFLFTLFISGSKTVLLILAILIVRYSFIRLKITLLFNLFSVLLCSFGLAAIFSLFEQLSTFSQRLTMWKLAIEQFFITPFLGAGITGVRSALSLEMRYVQPHNGWLALFVDHGALLGGVIMGIIYYMAITVKDRLTRYLLVVYIFLSFTNEMWVYPYWILFFVIAPLIMMKPTIHERKYVTKY